MSESPGQNEMGDREMDDRELERQLSKLVPSPLDPECLNDLSSDRVVAMGRTSGNYVHWKRLISLTLAASFVMVGYVSFRFGKASTRGAGGKSPVEYAKVDRPNSHAGKAVANQGRITRPFQNDQSRLVPVSSQGYLLKASSGGITQSKDGPVEELNLEYQDSYHWVDPATGTNIHFFTPRNERILVPVITD